MRKVEVVKIPGKTQGDFIRNCVGHHTIEVVAAGNGWPTILDVNTSSGVMRVAAHVRGLSSESFRGRDDAERKMMPPIKNSAVSVVPGAASLVLSHSDEPGRTVFVGFEADSRIGRPERRSAYVYPSALFAASESGWSEYIAGNGERVVAFRPELLPLYVELASRGLSPLQGEVQAAAVEARLSSASEGQEVSERARRVSSQIVRRAGFRSDVVSSYEERCAMCGLGLGLVEAAHILPASAPGSIDEVQNGVCLCVLHHRAFDRSLLVVDPEGFQILIGETVRYAEEDADSVSRLTGGLYSSLRLPEGEKLQPNPEFLAQRYELMDVSLDDFSSL